jgi:hypothetical protein
MIPKSVLDSRWSDEVERKNAPGNHGVLEELRRPSREWSRGYGDLIRVAVELLELRRSNVISAGLSSTVLSSTTYCEPVSSLPGESESLLPCASPSVLCKRMSELGQQR